MYDHQPVLLAEVIKLLAPKAGQSFIDCTLGGGGHTLAIAQRIGKTGKVLSLDLDSEAIKYSFKKLQEAKLGERVMIVKDNFKNLTQVATANLPSVSFAGILLDLGVSTPQLTGIKQGFSFSAEGLDMRMDKDSRLTAAAMVNTWPVDELQEIFKKFGQERLAGPIAKAIVTTRRQQKFTSSSELVEVVSRVYAHYYHRPSRLNPATKVFMALRIAVNNELENLRQVLPQAVSLLAPGGRLAVISFHSLEDKIVKEYFKRESKKCVCLPSLPVCQCQHQAILKIITTKLIVASESEIAKNPSARSAKLRVAQRL